MVSENTIARLSLYRRLLYSLRDDHVRYVFSHQLARIGTVKAAQVRRDIMALGCSGNPSRGYGVAELIDSISNLLDVPEGQQVALIGIGNLGRAIIAYLAGRRPGLTVVAAFDVDPSKTERVIHGCRCYHLDELPRVVEEKNITVAVITTPGAAAQSVTDLLVRSGVRAILNFAPTRLRVPLEVSVEDMDVTTSLEKVAFLARQREEKKAVFK